MKFVKVHGTHAVYTEFHLGRNTKKNTSLMKTVLTVLAK